MPNGDPYAGAAMSKGMYWSQKVSHSCSVTNLRHLVLGYTHFRWFGGEWGGGGVGGGR